MNHSTHNHFSKFIKLLRSVNLDWEMNASKIQKLETIFARLDFTACKVVVEKYHSIRITILNMMKLKAMDFIILIHLMK